MRHPRPADMPDSGDPGLHPEVTTDLLPGAWLIGGANAPESVARDRKEPRTERREARFPDRKGKPHRKVQSGFAGRSRGDRKPRRFSALRPLTFSRGARKRRKPRARTRRENAGGCLKIWR